MIDTTDFEMLKDERVKTRIQNIAEMLEKKFAKMIEDNFHNEIGKFKSWWKKLGIYAKKAKSYDGKANGLKKEEAKDFAMMRNNLNKWLGVSWSEIRKLNTQFRYNGKAVRVPIELLDYVLRTNFNLKALNAGKSIDTNEHWTKKYIPYSKHFESVWEKHQKAVAYVNQPKVEQNTVEQNTVVQNAVNVASETAASDVGISDKEIYELIRDL